ncbi:S-adenosylmethionine-dependent methyltransferase [Aspergillus undulatus]|uniref:S-adenosylmethionine-dependent methyltransferase n=1 Tax=Aspergillus undulatus TaxID=1810928 RepID=UPI003CCE03C5
MSDSTSLLSIRAKATPGPAPSGSGRGLFATADIRNCENILHIQSPFVAVLDTARLDDTCSGCFGKRQLASGPDYEIALKACTGCQVVKYCDKTCQAKDWKFAHSRECAIFKNLKPKVLPINARALLRVVLRVQAKKNAYTSGELDLFRTLETHIRDLRDGSDGNDGKTQWERVALTSKAIKTYSGTNIEEEVLSAYGAKLDVNSFNLTNALYDRVGLYLHPYAALINHSCDYNAVAGFDGDELYVTAIRPIAKDEQITISYVDTTYPTRTRQKELRERYFFTCTCSKCSQAEDPEPTGKAAAVARDAFALLESGNAGADLQKLLLMVQALISSKLPKTQQPFVSILDEAIGAQIPDEYHHAFLESAIRFSRIDPTAYPNTSHPIRAVHAWTLAKLTVYISQENPELAIPEFVKGGWQDFLGHGEVTLDYSLLAWTLLAELHTKENEYATVPGFKAIVKKTFMEVHREFMGNGLDPRGLRNDIQREWAKFGKVVTAYWQCVMREEP